MSCPICKKDTVQKYRPFCSKRCADVDLGKWLNESYVVPASDGDLPSESEIAEAAVSETKH